MILRFLFWFLERKFNHLYDGIDRESMEEWLWKLESDEGFRSYFRLRDLSLLKTMGQGLGEKDYWLAVGARRELLLLIGKVKQEQEKAELRKRKSEKDYAKQEGQKQEGGEPEHG